MNRHNLSHQNIVKLHNYGWWEGRFYLCIELLPGNSLRESIQEEAQLTNIQIAKLLLGVAKGLEHAHSRGILHRDIKPSNIMLSLARDNVAVKLVDFGLARLRDNDAHSDQAVGTALYMAPEQLQILKRSVDARSDLYSLGMVGCELLHGSHPFRNQDLGRLIHSQAAVIPGPPRGSTTPLWSIVERLIQKEPAERYQSASGLIYDLEVCLQRIQTGSSATFELGTQDKSGILVPSFSGREYEFKTLQRCYDAASEGVFRTVLVGGESGLGKTRLVEEFRSRIKTKHTWLSARGRAYGDKTAYGLISELLSQLPPLQLPTKCRERIRISIGELGGDLIEMEPALAEWLETPRASNADIDPERHKQRFFTVVGRLFESLPEKGEPVVLFFDDIQWADSGSLELLEHLMNENSEALAILSYREEELEDSVLANEFVESVRVRSETKELKLAPLNQQELTDLTEDLLGIRSQRLVDYLLEHGRGSPLWIVELVRALVSHRVLNLGPEGWSLDDELLSEQDLATTDSLRNLLLERLSRLDEDTLAALRHAAPIGKEFSLSLLLDVASADNSVCSQDSLSESVDKALSEQLLTFGNRPGHYAFTHDQIREALYEELDEEKRRDLHGLIGSVLQQQPEQDIYRLAFHFGLAHQREQSIKYGLLAGQRSLRHHAHREAQGFLEMALSNSPKPEQLVEIQEALGDAHTMLGGYPRALDCYAAARSGDSDHVILARLSRKRAAVHFRRMDMRQAISELTAALEGLGERVPRSKLAVIGFIIKECCTQAWTSLFGLRGKNSTDPIHREICELYNRLGYSYYFIDSMLGLVSHIRHINLAERFLIQSEMAQAYSNHAPGMALIPWYSRGLKYGRKSLEIRKKLGDTWGIAQSRHFLAVALANAGQWQEALEQCELAWREFQRLGDQWELENALATLLVTANQYGEWDKGEKYYRELRRIASRPDYTDGQAKTGLWLGTDLLIEREISGVLERTMSVLPVARAYGNIWDHVGLLGLLGRLRLAAGDAKSGLQDLKTAVDLLEKSRQHGEFLYWLFPALAEAYIANLNLPDQEPTSELLNGTRTVLRKAWFHSSYFRNHRPYTLRMQARFALYQGKNKKAEKLLRKAEQSALKRGIPYQQALALRELGELLSTSKPHQSLHCIRAAVKILKALDARKTLRAIQKKTAFSEHPVTSSASDTGVRRVDRARLQILLEVGRQLSATLDRDTLLKNIIGSAIRTLGGERGVLALGQAENQLEIVMTQGVDNFDMVPRSILEKVFQSGESVIKADALSDTEFDVEASIAASGIRSVICSPLRFGNKILGTLYLDNRLVTGMFTDQDLDVLDTLASQAAVAIENTRAFQELNDAADLRIAKEAAEEANKSKSLFLARMSHEIRTPMAAVIGLIDICASEELPPTTRGHITRIGQSARALLDILNTILDFSKIEAERIELERVALDLSRELDQVVALFETAAKSKNVRLDLSFPDNVERYLEGDPLRLRQVLSNLTSNAVKFTESGSITIGVSEISKSTDKVTVRFGVKDTGIGIAESAVATIFDSFSQADGSISRKYGGTGLGLPIAQGLVKAMGGELEVTSEVGVGTEFSFQLEFRRVSPDEVVVVELPSLPKTSLAGHRVLVVEDNEANQIVTSQIMSSLGAEVKTADDGFQALDLLKEEQFDIVFMDLHMPGMDGHETTRKVREELGLAQLRIIATTADALPSTRKRCEESGMNGFLSKPLEIPALAKVLGILNLEAEDFETQELDLPGIDSSRLLSRLRGKLSAIEVVLASFNKRFSGEERTLAEAWEQGRYKQAEGLIHQLKGASGNLAANNLYEISQQLETAIKARDKQAVEPLLVPFEEAFRRLLKTAEQYCQSLAAQVDHDVVITDEHKEKLDELASLLNRRSFSSLALYQELRPIFGNSDQAIKLGDAMTDMDFEKALLLVKKLVPDRSED